MPGPAFIPWINSPTLDLDGPSGDPIPFGSNLPVFSDNVGFVLGGDVIGGTLGTNVLGPLAQPGASVDFGINAIDTITRPVREQQPQPQTSFPEDCDNQRATTTTTKGYRAATCFLKVSEPFSFHDTREMPHALFISTGKEEETKGFSLSP